MRILTTLFFAFSFLCSIHAEEEPSNAEAVRTLKHNLFESNPDGGLYISIDFGSRRVGEDPTNSFNADADEGVRAGTVPINNRGVFGDLGASVGYQGAISNRISLRAEGGLRWMRFDLDNPTYSRVDFAPVPLDLINQMVQFEGTAEARGFRVGTFLDFHYGNSGSFVYVGSSYGLVNMSAQYNLTVGPEGSTLNDSHYINMKPGFEAGTVIRFGRTGLRIGYELTRFGQVDLTTAGGSALTVLPGNRHMVKVGLFHFFRRR